MIRINSTEGVRLGIRIMFYTIYKIKNLANGKEYIGKHQTKDLEDGYMGSGVALSKAIAKYGIESFKKEILHVFETEEDMNRKEAELVTEEYCLREDTYNICVGGQGGFSYINREVWTVEKRRAHNKSVTPFGPGFNESLKGVHSEAGKKGMSKAREVMRKKGIKPFKGRKHSEETLNKMRRSKNVGESNASYGTMWITNEIENRKTKKDTPIPQGWRKGRVITPE